MNTLEDNSIDRCEKKDFLKKIVDSMEHNPKTGWGYKIFSLFCLFVIVILPLFTIFMIDLLGYKDNYVLPVVSIVFCNILMFFLFLFKKEQPFFEFYIIWGCYLYGAYEVYSAFIHEKIVINQFYIYHIYLIISMIFSMFIVKFNNPIYSCIHDEKIRKEFINTKLKTTMYVLMPFFMYMLFLICSINWMSLLIVLICAEFISNSVVYYYVIFLKKHATSEYDCDINRRNVR